MSINVKPENEAYLNRLVAEGRYASLDEAADAAIASLRVDDGDMSWAKPYVDKALASLEQGAGIAAPEAFNQVRARCHARAGVQQAGNDTEQQDMSRGGISLRADRNDA